MIDFNATSQGVRLWDKNGANSAYNDGSGMLLQPVTELQYVSMTTGGGIVSSSNQLSLDAQSAWDSGIGAIVGGSYLPLSKSSTGSAAMTYSANTMYANMFTGNANATITQLPGSTGYGTLVRAIETVDSVGPVDSASNLAIPTELAVAIALEGKENTLVAGDCLTISANANDSLLTDIKVNTSGTVHADLDDCSTNAVPNEYAVRAAIANASNSLNGVITTVNNSVTTVNDSVTMLAGSVANIPVYGSATTASYGVVTLQNTVDDNTGASLPTASAIKDYVDQHAGGNYTFASGLTKDANNSVTLDIAGGASTSLGGVWVPAGSGLTLGANGRLVIATANATSLGGVKVDGTRGIVMNGVFLDLVPADIDSLGGVALSSSGGLTIDEDGILTISGATAYSTYASASASDEWAGVRVVNNITSTDVLDYINGAYVPTGQAVYNHVSESVSGATAWVSANYVSKTDYATSDTPGLIAVGGGLSIDNGTASVATDLYTFTSGLTKDANNSVTLDKAGSASTSLGGVWVPNNRGLSLGATGSLSLVSATATSLGGVKIPAHGGLAVEYGSLSVDPSQKNAWSIEPGATSGGSRTYIISKAVIVDSTGELLYYGTNKSSSFTSASSSTVYASVRVWRDRVEYTSTASTRQGFYAWSNTTLQETLYTTQEAPEVGAYVYDNTDPYEIVGHVTSAGGSSSLRALVYKCTLDTARPTLGWCEPVAYIETDALLNMSCYQLRYDPIVSGLSYGGTGGGGSGQPVSQGTGITVTNAGGSYTVGLSSATTTSLGGVIIGSGLGVTNGVVSALAAPYNGPFAVSLTGTGNTASIAGGVVYELDVAVDKGATTTVLEDGYTLYLYGSSGAYMTGEVTPYGQTYPTVDWHHRVLDYKTLNTAPTAGWAGESYMPIASRSGNAIVQLQYGDIHKEHWGDDYREEFNMSRIPRNIVKGAGQNDYYLPFTFQIKNGGRVLGISESTIAVETIAYPAIELDAAIYSGTDSGSATYIASGATVYNGLYLKTSGVGISGGTTYDGAQRIGCWLNIWSGTWPVADGGHTYNTITPTDAAWRYIVDTKCYEGLNLSYAKNAYSVQLGYITMNGAPIQIHKGAIDVRGRWS